MSNQDAIEKDQTPSEQGDAQESAGALAQIQQELAETKDRYLRTLADLANLKKKMAHDRHDAREKGMVAVVEELLPILDNLERAEKALEQGGDLRALRDGVALVFSQLRANLKKKGLEPIRAIGEQFDPHFHEAVGRIPTSEIAEGHVAQEVQRGYRLGARVIRPSRVMVATEPERNGEDEG